MSPQLFWLHEEVLSEGLLQKQYAEGCRFLFVFDTVWLTQRPVSLKRVQFIYEALVAMPFEIEIVYGDAAEVLKQQVRQHPGLTGKVIAPKDPELAERVEGVASEVGVSVLERPRWFASPGKKVSRFFKFYNSVRSEALQAARIHRGEL
ncbi:MAG: hypothetical protein P8N63_13295 [Pseudomonadales bacterium]|nr:hypothetical protein [Pseudomonadales bacterium]